MRRFEEKPPAPVQPKVLRTKKQIEALRGKRGELREKMDTLIKNTGGVLSNDQDRAIRKLRDEIRKIDAAVDEAMTTGRRWL